MTSRREHEASATVVIVGSVVRHWTRAIEAHPRGVVVLSPFVTSQTAETVLKSAGEHPVRIYTLFEARLFASGASQVSTLRRLAELGHRIFHVPRLHAKVVLTRKVATVGSQNLTGGGQNNRETTVVLHDRRHVGVLRAELRQWLATAEQITLERIVEMERSLDPLRRTFRKFKAEAEQIDAGVAERARQQSRQQRRAAAEEARIRADQERERQVEDERIRRLRAMVEESERSSWALPVRVTHRPYETLVLRRPHSDDLISWWISDEHVSLDRRHRYLLVSPNGRLAWPALNKTRLTQFGSGLSNGRFDFAERAVHVAFSAVPSPHEGDANVELKLSTTSHEAPVIVRAWFDLERVELRTATPPDRPGEGARWILSELDHHRDELLAALAGRLLEPFQYTTNRSGLKAREFLGFDRSYFHIRLHRRAGMVFLALE